MHLTGEGNHAPRSKRPLKSLFLFANINLNQFQARYHVGSFVSILGAWRRVLPVLPHPRRTRGGCCSLEGAEVAELETLQRAPRKWKQPQRKSVSHQTATGGDAALCCQTSPHPARAPGGKTLNRESKKTS